MTIVVEREGPLMLVGFARAAKRHALTEAMFTALAQSFEQAQADPAVRVLVLHGSSDCFTAGYDLDDLCHAPPRGQTSAVWRFLSVLTQFPKPLLAAPCGPAVGIGTTLLLYCDAVYAGDNARFALPFTHLGLCPEAGASVLLPARIGWPRAAQMLLWGDSVSAHQACDWGLVNTVLPPDQVLDYARERSMALAALSQEALVETKRLMREPHAAAIATALAEEAAAFMRLLAAPDAQQSIQAYTRRPAGRQAAD